MPYLEKLIVVGLGQGTQVAAYEANEIDFAWGNQGLLSPADIAVISADPELSAQYFPHYADFRTYYFFFDDTQPPFDDLRVRQAFAYALDRDAILENIVRAPGYPGLFVPDARFPGCQLRGIQGHLSLRRGEGASNC